MTGYKLGCTPAIWLREATAEAERAGLKPAQVLGGGRKIIFVRARWRIWSALYRRGFSILSIGRASGFDPTTVRHGLLRSGIELRPARFPHPYFKIGQNIPELSTARANACEWLGSFIDGGADTDNLGIHARPNH